MDTPDPSAKPPPAPPPIYGWPPDQQARPPGAQQGFAPPPSPGFDPYAQDVHVRMMRDAHRASGHRMMIVGGVIALLGIVITAATYSSASQAGGTYIVAYGPIIGGVITFFRGLARASG
jgi:hypothetical protein